MNPMFDILVCPQTGQDLVLAEPSCLKVFNRCIEKKLVRSQGGRALAKLVEALLLRQDLKVAYVVRDGLPIMIAEQAVEIQTLSDRQWLSELKCVKTNLPS